MKDSKLVVAGCSVSDYTKVEFNYGELLSKEIGYEYLHLAAGCGSNQRSLRELITRIIKGEITSKDTVLLQYTDITRKEFWSRFNRLERTGHFIADHKATNLREFYGDGNTIKYKIDASQWQPEKIEQQFFDLYENNFLSYKYESEMFINNHFSFLTLLKQYNIRCLFVIIEGYVLNGMERNDREDFFDSFKIVEDKRNISYIDVTSILVDNVHLRLEKEYAAHYTQEGHEVLSNTLHEELIKLNWI